MAKATYAWGTVESRRRLVAELRATATPNSLRAIAEAVGVCAATVRRDLELAGQDAERRSMVYAIELVDFPGIVKFGRSLDPRSRLAELSTGSPFEMRLAAMTFETEEINEAYLHLAFHHYRMRGEWFDLRPRLKGRMVAQLLHWEEPPGFSDEVPLAEVLIFPEPGGRR